MTSEKNVGQLQIREVREESQCGKLDKYTPDPCSNKKLGGWEDAAWCTKYWDCHIHFQECQYEGEESDEINRKV